MILDQYGNRAEIAAPRQSASLHPFDAAKRSGFQGYFYFPTLKQEDLINQPTRDEINRKVTWLYNNVDPVRLVVDGLSLEEVDTGIWPKATTSNPAFNKKVTRAFHEQNKDPRFFSASGAESFYSAQWMLRRTIRLYGELFGQMIRPGYPINLPCMHFINSWQCGASLGKQEAREGWREGVKRMKVFNRPISYRFSNGDGKDDFVDTPADDVLHFHDQFFTGQVRGLSCLTPVVTKLFRLEEIERLESSGVRLRAKQAYALEKNSNDNIPVVLPGASKVETIKNEDGTTVTLQKVIQGDGDDIDVAVTPSGYKFSVLESSRPSITIDFMKWICGGVANVTLYPAGYVFSVISDYDQGTAVRFSVKRVQRIKNTVRQFQLIPQFVDRWYSFWLWMRILTGEFNDVGVPDDWYEHKNICPADDSVDVGREGKLNDERVKSGLMSPSTYHGLAAEDDEDVDDEVMAVRVRRLKRLKDLRLANPDIADGLTYDSLWPGSKSAAAVEDEDLDDPKKSNKKNSENE